MIRALRFEKWQGLGNDFVLVEDGPADPELAITICDRRRGVGGDGLIVVRGIEAGQPTMIVLNADGSRPEMCGNGVRCVAALVAERRGLADTRIAIATDAGIRECLVASTDCGVEVTVDMGIVRAGPDLVVDLEGRELRFATADVGNPHAVTFEPFDEAAIDRIGPRVSTLPPSGFNVEFCRASQARVDVVVWERGVGRTLACGTGACAVAFVACASGRAEFGAPVVVGLPGGDLAISIDASTHRATMRGPARRAFIGEVTL